jgi:hypothetical protein
VPHELDDLVLELLAQWHDLIELVRPSDQNTLVANEGPALFLAGTGDIGHRVDDLNLGRRVELDIRGILTATGRYVSLLRTRWQRCGLHPGEHGMNGGAADLDSNDWVQHPNGLFERRQKPVLIKATMRKSY